MAPKVDPSPTTRSRSTRSTNSNVNAAQPPASNKKGKERELPKPLPSPSPPPPPPVSAPSRRRRAQPKLKPLPPPPSPSPLQPEKRRPVPRPVNPEAKARADAQRRAKQEQAAKKAEVASKSRLNREAMEAAVAFRRFQEAEEIRRKEETAVGVLAGLQHSSMLDSSGRDIGHAVVDEYEEEDCGTGEEDWDCGEVGSTGDGVDDEDFTRLKPWAVGEESDDEVQFVEAPYKQYVVDEQAARAARTDNQVLDQINSFRRAMKSKAASSQRTHVQPVIVPTRTSRTHSDEDDDVPEPDFELLFKVPYANGAVRELKLPASTSWHGARVKIAEKMVRDASSLHLVYTFSWEQKNGRKPAPTALQDEDEWASLVGHVRAYVVGEKARNRGSGSVRPFHILLENAPGMAPAPGTAARATSSSSKATSALPRSSSNTDLDRAAGISKDPDVGALVAKLMKDHHCEHCGKACVVLSDAKHRPLTMKILSKWATGIHLELPGMTIEKFPDILRPNLMSSSDGLQHAPSHPATTEEVRKGTTSAASGGNSPAVFSHGGAQFTPGDGNGTLPHDAPSTATTIPATVTAAALSGATLSNVHAAALAGYLHTAGLLPGVYPQPQASIPGTFGAAPLLPNLFPAPATLTPFGPGMPYNGYPVPYSMAAVAPPPYHGAFQAQPPVQPPPPAAYPMPLTPHRESRYHSNRDRSRYFSDHSPTPHHRRSRRSEYYDHGSPTSARSQRLGAMRERSPVRHMPYYPPPRAQTPEPVATSYTPERRSHSPMQSYSRPADAYMGSPSVRRTYYMHREPSPAADIPPPLSPLRVNPRVNYSEYDRGYDL